MKVRSLYLKPIWAFTCLSAGGLKGRGKNGVVVMALNMARFDEVINKLESDVLQLRDELEDFYQKYRCDEGMLSTCAEQNLDECRASLPNATCLSGPNFALPVCGSSEACSGYFDFVNSVYRIPPGEDESRNLALVEDVCYSRHMDDHLAQKRREDASYWLELGLEPRAQYFGSHNGMMRIYPGRPSEVCGGYDPRIRPWYVAGSSGPKNVVMILDQSGSMQGLRLSLMKQAAKRVIDTLTPVDRIAIVAFNEATTVIADQGRFLYSATASNKAVLHQAVDALQARGNTAFYKAFSDAFEILDDSIANEYNVPCNTAILFLTDGVMQDPDTSITESNVTDLVVDRIERMTTELGKPTALFSFSVSEEEDVHELPKQLACSTEFGTWSRIDDIKVIVDALAGYYRLFALGLGIDKNADFTAWVEPYRFSTGNIWGTTVSAPVYDRSKSPHLFLGVFAMDIALEALNRALETDDTSKAIELLARRSVARCPALSLGECELESYRTATGGMESRCEVPTCSIDDDVETIAKQCTDSAKYPDVLVSNTQNDGLSYEDRACCVSGETHEEAAQCAVSPVDKEESDVSVDADSNGKGLVIGIVLGVLIVLGLLLLGAKHVKREEKITLPPPVAPPSAWETCQNNK